MTASGPTDMVKALSGYITKNDDYFLTDAALRVFPDASASRWLAACRKIEHAGYGQLTLETYVRHAIEIAGLVGAEPAIEIADTVSLIAIRSGRRSAEAFPATALQAVHRLGQSETRFNAWRRLMEWLVTAAPESFPFALEKTDKLLSMLNLSGLEAWMLAGIRLAGSDAEKRQAFFSFKDPEAERWLLHESDSVNLSEMSTELKAFMGALWNTRIRLLELPTNAFDQARRRASFSSGIVQVPSTFSDFKGEHAENLFRAIIAHIGAHMKYSGARFPIDKLKPLQVALISLIEDARVEQLAIREFPGLRRLWLPFHVARPGGAITATDLMARLSRRLIDPDFKEIDGWVRRAHDMFFDRKDEWENPAISRQIGGLIGNDLGQMRIQFNARTYVTEPPYRDDNMGLWDFDDQEIPDFMEAAQLFDSVDIQEQEDDDETPPDMEREEHEQDETDDINKISVNFIVEEGMPVARYAEYDYLTGSSRPDWTTIVEYPPPQGAAHIIDQILEEEAFVVNRITSLITSAKVSQPQKLLRQPEGDFLDLNACIEATISRRIGEVPDPYVYGRAERRNRDLSVLVLLDISESTKDLCVGSPDSILDVERKATALLAHAMDGLGDPFAIAAFNSNGREDVRYHRIKDFGSPYGVAAKASLAGLKGGYSTRMGAAMRHAAEDLKRQQTHRRLLLVITDGEPSDIDVPDKQYLTEDARHVIQGLAMAGINVFCVGLDSGGDNYMNRIFGQRNMIQIDRLERLPEKLPMLYFRLTA